MRSSGWRSMTSCGAASWRGAEEAGAEKAEGECVRGKASMPDNVHLIAIPPKYAMSQLMGYVKGKSAIKFQAIRCPPPPLDRRGGVEDVRWSLCF